VYTKGYRCVVNAVSSKDGQDCARKSRADKGSTAVVIKCRWQHILTNYEIQCFLRLDYLNLITVIQAAFLRTCKGRSQWSSGSAPDCKHCHGYYYYYYYYAIYYSKIKNSCWVVASAKWVPTTYSGQFSKNIIVDTIMGIIVISRQAVFHTGNFDSLSSIL